MRACATCGHECSFGGKLSSPAVQQLWTLYPGKHTGNPVLRKSCFPTSGCGDNSASRLGPTNEQDYPLHLQLLNTNMNVFIPDPPVNTSDLHVNTDGAGVSG
ncbi:hypothetical protein Tco_1196849 [Tanacetum coccineum]